MKVFVQMPIDTPFKSGDVVLERGYRITNADGEGKAIHEDLDKLFLRPASTELAEGSDPARLLEIASRLQSIAKEIERL